MGEKMRDIWSTVTRPPTIGYTRVTTRKNDMTQKGPGKCHREGISLVKLMKMFHDDEAARKCFEARI